MRQFAVEFLQFLDAMVAVPFYQINPFVFPFFPFFVYVLEIERYQCQILIVYETTNFPFYDTVFAVRVVSYHTPPTFRVVLDLFSF